MNLNTEIRKLSPGDLHTLVQILELDESWKKLMAVIPKFLPPENYDCKITYNNLPKYNTDHFKLIDNAGLKQQRACAEILLEEWGCSGRVRPKLGHLITLLQKTELFRAADYLAMDLLKLSEVERPVTGPAAKVEIPEDLSRHIPQNQSINYPSSLLDGDRIASSIINEIIDPKPQHVIPTIIINEFDENNLNTHSNGSIIKSEERKIENRVRFQDIPEEITNEENTDNIPAFSTLLDKDTNGNVVSEAINNVVTNTYVDNYSPNFSDILQMSNSGNSPLPDFSNILKSSCDNNSNISNNIPDFSNIMLSETINSNYTPDFSNLIETTPSDGNIPAFSQILISESPVISDVSNSNEGPDLSGLLPDNFTKYSVPCMDIPHFSDLLTISPAPSIGSNSSRTCASPLPNLLLNTVLPHFTYIELEQCTENFDETSLTSQNSDNFNVSETVGRKLGSGAFGSVYLGLGLLDKPIAVKKLNLNGVNVVNVDDTITKQFKNEVEILCKYKHENLLSLLGYSCDGPTYCLIYEYVCGGALKDRLQSSLKSPEHFRLLWTDRLYIGLGTAKAVSYLHTAYSMPLIHRDIKSANILLDNANKPKLCDFGLIKLTPNPNTNTSTTVFGTSAYMAPEAFRGDVSVKLDTFSFGVVLLELLTSLPPLDENREGNDLVTHIDEVVTDDIKPLLDINAGTWTVDQTHFGEELFDIAMQCLEEKKRRPVMPIVVMKLSELIKKAVPT